MSTKCTRPWNGSGVLGSHKFFNIPGSEGTSTNHSGRSTSSLQNRLEGKTAVTLVALLCSTSHKENLFWKNCDHYTIQGAETQDSERIDKSIWSIFS